jgi:hypothetical protein
MPGLRGLSGAVFGALLTAVGLAPPASAVLLPPPDGYYTFNMEGVPESKWEMQTLCTQPNGTREQSDYTNIDIQNLGCKVLVTSTTQRLVTREEQLANYSGWALLKNGMWTFTILQNGALTCPDGSSESEEDIYAFTPPDPNGPPNLTGTHTDIHPAVCGLQPGMQKKPFSLTYIGPLKVPPLERFPMECGFLAGRPSICS